MQPRRMEQLYEIETGLKSQSPYGEASLATLERRMNIEIPHLMSQSPFGEASLATLERRMNIEIPHLMSQSPFGEASLATQPPPQHLRPPGPPVAIPFRGSISCNRADIEARRRAEMHGSQSPFGEASLATRRGRGRPWPRPSSRNPLSGKHLLQRYPP